MTLPPGTTEHKSKASQRPPVRCAVVTVSDSRTEATDESGDLIRRLLLRDGHQVVHSALLKNDEGATRALAQQLVADESVDAIILTGGTGLSHRDRTIEAVESLFTRTIPGFGELFRHVSFTEQIGPAAMLSRAAAGACGGTLIVTLPGSRAAVELALTRLLLPELSHLVYELSR
jgi:molybdenum cofactor biosynthesis protein B